VRLPDAIAAIQTITGNEGVSGIRDMSLLESALGRPQATLFGKEAYPGLLLKAAALLHSLIRNHALHDGNKRTAWALTVYFLQLNGQVRNNVEGDARVLFTFLNRIASGEINDLNDIAVELSARFVEAEKLDGSELRRRPSLTRTAVDLR
jgi:death-on-curing protein